MSSATVTTLVSGAHSPTYSRDGTKIAFMRFSEGPYSWDIWVMNANGSNKQNVTKMESRYYSVSWAPNGQRLLYSEYDGNPTGEVRMHHIRLDGTGRQEFAPNVAGSMADGVYSPDGTKVAYVGSTPSSEPRLRTINANGAPASVQGLAPTLTNVMTPDWSPGGAFLTFSRRVDEPYKTMVFRVKSDGTGLLKLVDLGSDVHAEDPVWSPDATKILFGIRAESTGGFEIWRMSSNGSNRARVDTNGYNPSWQPVP